MNLVNLDELFDITYGVNLDLNKLVQCEDGINYVGRTEKNNGVTAKVKKLDSIKPNPANTISVSCGGSVLESFVQTKPYYSGRDLFYLTPKKDMTIKQMLYYCMCIRANKYKYNFGRQPNKTLGKLKLPDILDIPGYVEKTVIKNLSNCSDSMDNDSTPILNTSNWKTFIYNEIFDIRRGDIGYYKNNTKKGDIPYIGASNYNNGITDYVDESNRKGNLISLAYDGSVASAFYQPDPFFASEKIVTLDLKDYKLNKYIAMFIITVIRLEKFRYNYGYKWSVETRLVNTKIKLPSTKDGKPDYKYMEDYIKTLPYSVSI